MRLTYLLSRFVMCEACSLFRSGLPQSAEMLTVGEDPLWPEVGEVMVGLMRQPYLHFNVTVPAEWPTNMVYTRTQRR